MTQPIQPLTANEKGIIRFVENKIVRDLLDFATPLGFGLNEMARKDYSREDRVQFAQLIGYSLNGFGTLSYVTDQDYEAAELMHKSGVSDVEARAIAAEDKLKALKDAIRGPVAELFEVHPDALK